ncbi:hypothetical protein D3C71_24350 [compost metagenome]
MQAKTPRMTTDQARQLLADFRELDEAGKQEFIRALAAELKNEFGTERALKAVSEHLQQS